MAYMKDLEGLDLNYTTATAAIRDEAASTYSSSDEESQGTSGGVPVPDNDHGGLQTTTTPSRKSSTAPKAAAVDPRSGDPQGSVGESSKMGLNHIVSGTLSFSEVQQKLAKIDGNIEVLREWATEVSKELETIKAFHENEGSRVAKEKNAFIQETKGLVSDLAEAKKQLADKNEEHRVLSEIAGEMINPDMLHKLIQQKNKQASKALRPHGELAHQRRQKGPASDQPGGVQPGTDHSNEQSGSIQVEARSTVPEDQTSAAGPNRRNGGGARAGKGKGRAGRGRGGP
ncbi:hypothetical protein G7Y79_00009g025850 [Physcia stellaris]|nr:hypothetical protein G7Y79_00009g025850 [Physcia stellaris]